MIKELNRLWNHKKRSFSTRINYQRILPKNVIADFQINSLNLESLPKIFQQAIAQNQLSHRVHTKLKPQINLQDRIEAIIDQLEQFKSIGFKDLINHETSRADIIVYFLALLELSKLRLLRIRQETIFNYLTIEKQN